MRVQHSPDGVFHRHLEKMVLWLHFCCGTFVKQLFSCTYAEKCLTFTASVVSGCILSIVCWRSFIGSNCSFKPLNIIVLVEAGFTIADAIARSFDKIAAIASANLLSEVV